VLQLTAYYPRRSQKSMGAMGRKMSSFLLTKYTGSYLEIFLNNLIKMWEQFRILEFSFIILFIIIGRIFLISSSDLVSMLSTIVGEHFCIDSFLLCIIIPIKIYSNAEADKSTILSDNRNKTGIYMWKNTINDKRYIGSSVDLSNRLSFYFSFKALKNSIKNSKSSIYNALLKHGHSNFSLIIMEYCEPYNCLIREKHYLDLYKPEYNISQDPSASFSGRNHSEETKQTISDALTGSKRSDDTRKKMSDAQPNSIKIEVTDLRSAEKTSTYYNSINEAARALKIHKSVIGYYFSRNQQKPYKDQYIFKKI